MRNMHKFALSPSLIYNQTVKVAYSENERSRYESVQMELNINLHSPTSLESHYI